MRLSYLDSNPGLILGTYRLFLRLRTFHVLIMGVFYFAVALPSLSPSPLEK